MFDYEMTELVGLMCLGDPRVAPADAEGFAATVAFWHATVGDLDYGDARDVVHAHYRTALPSDPRLTPGAVLAGVKEIRAARLQGVTDDDLTGDVDGRHPRYHRIWVLRQQHQMARPGSPEAEECTERAAALLPVTDEEAAVMEAARHPRQIGQRRDGAA
jgi:hypothetical protein